MTCRLADSMTCRLADPMTCRLAGSMTCRLADSMTCRLADSMTCRLADSMTCRLADSMMCRLDDSMTCRLADSMTCRLADSMRCRLAGSMTCRLTDSMRYVDECQTSPCHKNSRCINTVGSYLCYCEPGYYGDGKTTCEPAAECIGWGDPHYITFDGYRFHFMGECKYVLTRPCSRSGPVPYFEVLTQNEYRGIRSRLRGVTYTKYAEVRLFDRVVELKAMGVVYVDGVRKRLPYSVPLGAGRTSIISAVGSDGSAMTTDFGLRVTFDGLSRLAVHVPAHYARQLCGLCGNYDGYEPDIIEAGYSKYVVA
ncbi:Zonadhesin [Lamellibrachia satsuma]|nr:Zonadhesin [Lamellibrachia satsuma]